MNQDLAALVGYRIGQANDALRAADALLNEGLWRDSVNRSYYAMFYAVLALLALKGTGTSKHTGAIAMFDKDYVKAGLFSKELSQTLHRTFEMRLEADYDEVSTVSEQDAQLVVSQAREFVGKLSEHLRQQTSL